MHTLHTKSLTELRIHIAPVGFEIDRIVIPAKQMKADRVCLLIHENRANDKALPYVEEIKKQLKKERIQVVLEDHNRLELFQIIKSIKNLIKKESKNKIYVNLASGSKIQAIGGMMACMMFNENQNITPFYSEAAKYSGFSGKQQSTGIKELMEIPSYQIQTPNEKLVQALKIIQENDGKLTKKKMAEIAEEKKLITVNAENESQARFASLDKNIIQPLLNWKFIDVEKIGRNNWIQMSDEGKSAAEFLI